LSERNTQKQTSADKLRSAVNFVRLHILLHI